MEIMRTRVRHGEDGRITSSVGPRYQEDGSQREREGCTVSYGTKHAYCAAGLGGQLSRPGLLIARHVEG